MFRRFVLKRSTLDNRFEPAGAQPEQPSTSFEFPVKPEHNLESLRPRVVRELKDIVCSENVLTEEADLIAYAEALLLFAFDGNYEQAVHSELETVAMVCTNHGARSVQTAQNTQESDRLWQARRSISPALARRKPNNEH